MSQVSKQPCSGWGRHPWVNAIVHQPGDEQALRQCLLTPPSGDRIPRGNGRSYGDSGLAGEVISNRWMDELIHLDEDHSVLRCHGGITIASLTGLLLPRGWMLPVVPGTAAVSVAGAVAADIHGKNHHIDGCFSQHIDSLRLMSGDGELIECSPTQRPEVFHATCGGMGLTGSETLSLLARHNDSPYSVAWLDSTAPGPAAGRGVVLLGEHFRAPPTSPPGPAVLSIPFSPPGLLINQPSVKLFNALYYRLTARPSHQVLHCQRYFFPLDGIRNWNRLYGRKGFLQYQFVVPDASAEQAIGEVLARIHRVGIGSFLTVLKRTGPANPNPLSFPLSGYTLALDFKYSPDLLPVLDSLDGVIADAGGRIYLAKDARLSKAYFQRMYPRWGEFTATRRALGAHHHFNSLQSRRLGL